MTFGARVIPFVGVRMNWTFELALNDLLQELLTELGYEGTALVAKDLLERNEGIATAEPKIHPPPICASEWTLLGMTNATVGATGVPSKNLVLLEIGRPTGAMSMRRSDPQAALFSAVRLILSGHTHEATCSLTYVVPSTLLVQEDTRDARSILKELDVRVDALIRRASGIKQPQMI